MPDVNKLFEVYNPLLSSLPSQDNLCHYHLNANAFWWIPPVWGQNELKCITDHYSMWYIHAEQVECGITATMNRSNFCISEYHSGRSGMSYFFTIIRHSHWVQGTTNTNAILRTCLLYCCDIYQWQSFQGADVSRPFHTTKGYLSPIISTSKFPLFNWERGYVLIGQAFRGQICAN
jgi:hypothetical protein